MRVGLFYEHNGGDPDLRSLFTQVATADGLGFDNVWIADRLFTDDGLGSPAIVLAALAKRTRVIRLGAFVVLGLQHPPRVAEDFAMIDLLSGGRLNFGAAPGTEPAAFGAFRVPFAERAAHFREALDIVLAAWSMDEFSYGGQQYQFPAHIAAGSGLVRKRHGITNYLPQWERGPETPDCLTVTPKPLQQPRPPVWIVAEEPEWVTYAGEGGHSVVLPFGTLAELERAANVYEAALRSVRRERSEVELAVIVDIQLEGGRVAAGTLAGLHRLHDATGLNQVIWRVPVGTAVHDDLLAAFSQVASEVQPMLQA